MIAPSSLCASRAVCVASLSIGRAAVIPAGGWVEVRHVLASSVVAVDAATRELVAIDQAVEDSVKAVNAQAKAQVQATIAAEIAARLAQGAK